ncbi:MAG: MG2 domain-containing protein [Saprospiraceae bacterium]
MRYLSRTLSLCLFLSLIISCKKGFKPTTYSSEEIGRYIAARVPSVIDVSDPVRIRFAVTPDTTQTASVFSFNPDIKGTAYWEDNMTLAFRPDNGWKPGQAYQLQVNLDRVIKDLDPKMKKVVFNFEVKPVRMMVSFDPLVPEFDGDTPNYSIRGRVTTSVKIDSQQLEKAFVVKPNGKMESINWFHSTDGYSHDWVIDGITPDSKLDFQWSGESFGSKETGHRSIEIPKGDVLSVISFEPGDDGDKKISIYFSQKLDPNQDLKGLVTINGSTEGFKLSKNDYILSIYPEESVSDHMTTEANSKKGQLSIQLSEKIASASGKELGKPITMDVSLEDAKPSLRLVGSGVITPGNTQIIFPFEAINLKSVQVEVMRIFENNILQYLQENGLEDQYNLEPVGQIILQKNIDLQSMTDRDNKFIWTRYALDLGPLVTLAPGSIYQVRIGFKGTDTYLDCYKEPTEAEEEKAPYGEMVSMWSYDYHYEDFDWDQTDDPCYPAYYGPEKYISRNILASDIGLTAKQNDEGHIWVYANALGTVQPKSGVTIEIYDYQQQLLNKSATSTQGDVSTEIPRKAFFVVATDGNQKGYLRMADGLSLSLSEFNAGGTGYQSGLRGYIYTERDVWRPGDSVHLNFILWDPEGKIDDRHPVNLTVTNPLGQKDVQRTSPISIGGIYDLAFRTSTTAPTGTWIAKVEAGDAVFTKALRIETIKPNRLKVDAKLPKELTFTEGGKIDLESSWLFGAPAANLKAIVEAQFSPLEFSPVGFKDFTFSDPARKTPSTVTSIFDGTLDAQGKAQITLPNIRESLPEGQLTMNLKTRVFESGGDFSTDHNSTIFHPYDHYAGISIPANRWGYEEMKINEPNDVRLASVTSAGKGASGHTLTVGLYNANWRWWWDQTGGDITQYNSELHLGAIHIDTVTTGGNGIVNYKIKPSTYGAYMVRVCDTQSGHCSGKFYYAGSWGDPSSTNDAANRLTFTADKEKYEVGDKIKLNIPSASGSKILLTLEKNNKVLTSKWYDVTSDQTQITLDATADMMPNVYAFVSHVQPYEHSSNDMPLRMYGVLPIMVSDPTTLLHPILAVSDVLQPDKEFTVSVSEKDKLPMAYTIAVVDEGLLGLTRFQSPDPWEYFHRQEALAVQTWDMFDQVLGGYGGTIDRLLSLGGDGAAKLVDAPQAQRFKPVVMHLGPFYLDAGQKKTHTFKMPSYVGAVRVMLVASDRKRWGAAEKTATVKADLMMYPTLPRVVSPGETITLPVNVYAMADNMHSVDVQVTTNDMASMADGGTQNLQFATQGDKMVFFNLKIADKPGLLKVDITSKSGSTSTSQHVELDVRLPNPPLTEVVAATITPGQKWTGKIPLPGMKGTNEASVELSQMPPINLQKRLEYLIHYPYGCIEQTLSSVFPQLYLAALTDLTTEQEKQVRKNIQDGISSLRLFTLPSGGFSYWPGENFRDSWSNSYAGHFLVEAVHAGYTVDKSMMDGWRSAEKKDAQAYTPRQYYREDVTQAYRLYTLALDGQPLWGMMNRLRTEKDLDPAASWLLAGAYALGKRNDVANQIIDKLSTDVKPYEELGYTYGSDLRDKALILETFLLLGKQDDAMTIARTIAAGLSSELWYSTQTTSWSLLALGKLAKQFSGKQLKATITQSGKSPESVSTTKGIVLRKLDVNSETMTVENTSSDPVFLRVTGTGRPLKGVTAEVKNNLSLKVKYLNIAGKEISPDKLNQGQDFVVQIAVTNPGTFTTHLDEMALSYLFPSGWELSNQRMDQFEGRFANSVTEYDDIRDDRVNEFFSMDRGVWTYHFMMTATYAGRYWLPDIMCEAMYSHQVRARIPGRWVEVVPGNAGKKPI